MVSLVLRVGIVQYGIGTLTALYIILAIMNLKIQNWSM